MHQPLHGTTVLALEQAVAAPLATRHLADLGARVIKVERPGGGDFARHYDRTVRGQSSYFVWLNRGKQSVELDLKIDADASLLKTMAADADVFVQNLAPGAAERLGLGAEALRAENPRLIHCSISGYGTDGPYRFKKAYDLLVQCEAGLLMTTGTPEAPAKVGVSIADIATGMYAYSGILTALYQRERVGEGSSMHVAMIDAMGEWMSQPAYLSAYGNQPTRRTGAHHASIAPYGPYLAGDGTSIFLAVQNDREWETLCTEVLFQPALLDDTRFRHNVERVSHAAELSAIIEASWERHGAEEAVRLLDQAGIANARLRTPADLVEHPQLLARNRWRPVDTPGGFVQALAPPVDVSGAEAPMRAVPAFGEHTAAIREEFALLRTGRRSADMSGIIRRTEVLQPGPAEAFARLLGAQAPELSEGDSLPLLWHWLYLTERPAQEDLGIDGHPLRDSLPEPPAAGMRRMWAGGWVLRLGPLRCGESATRTSRISSTQVKQGRSGPMTFVSVEHTITQRDETVVSEQQDIVYRPADDATHAAPRQDEAAMPSVPAAAGEWPIDVSTTLLFRFSALTYNAHRIHYDRDYARDAEGYPGLVVHGPLQAMAMAEHARRQGHRAQEFRYRLLAPLFEHQGLVVTSTPSPDGIETGVRDLTGRPTATGTLSTMTE